MDGKRYLMQMQMKKNWDNKAILLSNKIDFKTKL